MKVNLVRIGNSRGVRLPSSVIRECGFGDEIELRVDRGMVVLAPAQGGREGWDAAFARMAGAGDDAALLGDAPETEFDKREWTW